MGPCTDRLPRGVYLLDRQKVYRTLGPGYRTSLGMVPPARNISRVHVCELCQSQGMMCDLLVLIGLLGVVLTAGLSDQAGYVTSITTLWGGLKAWQSCPASLVDAQERLLCRYRIGASSEHVGSVAGRCGLPEERWQAAGGS